MRYIILNEGHPPFLTEWYDPENNEPADGSNQTVIDLASGRFRQNFGDKAGQWIEMEFDHL